MLILSLLTLFPMFFFTANPTEVKLGIYVNSFYSISEQTMVSLHIIDIKSINDNYYSCIYHIIK